MHVSVLLILHNLNLGISCFVELPQVGDDIKAGEPFGSVESVKTVSELYAPISGKVVEVNSRIRR